MVLALLWAVGVLFAVLGAVVLYHGLASRWGRGLAVVMAAVVALAPLERAAAHGLVAWLYGGGLPVVSDRVMASRQILPLAHYEALADGVLTRALAALAAGLVLWALVWWSGQPQGRARWRALLSNRGFQVVAGAVFLAVAAFAGYNLWMSVQMHTPHPVFYTDCHKVWGHRGHPDPPKIVENTIPSYENAFNLGAPGIETDVLYDPDRREYYIGRYDRGSLPVEGKRLTLDEVFLAVGDRGYFWLDTKTIHRMNAAEAKQAAQDMYDLLQRHHLLDRAIVESDTPQNLVYFARLGIHTSYWIFNIDESAFPKTPWALWKALHQVQENYIRGGFSAISMDKRFYTPMVAWMLRGARIHLFTAHSRTEVEDLVQRSEVKVVLTDTTDFDVTTCGK